MIEVETTQEQLLKNKADLDKHTEWFISKVKPFIQSKDYPLANRWEVFKTCKVGEHKLWTKDFTFDGEEISWYDDHGIDTHTTILMADIVSNYEDKQADLGAINQLKEDILDKFVWSFVYDW